MEYGCRVVIDGIRAGTGLVCQRERRAPKGDGLQDPTSVGERNKGCQMTGYLLYQTHFETMSGGVRKKRTISGTLI